MKLVYLYLYLKSKENILKNNNEGFTLIEVIVGLMATGLIITLATSGIFRINSVQQKAVDKSNMRINLTRAQSYLLDDVSGASYVEADPGTAPQWSWTSNLLASGTPTSSLIYIKVPVGIQQICGNDASRTASRNKIYLESAYDANDDFDVSNAISLSGGGTLTPNLVDEDSSPYKYYIQDIGVDDLTDGNDPCNTTTATGGELRTWIKLKNTIAGSTAKDLGAGNSSGQLYLNKLIIYYWRTATSSWYGPNTINRSSGDCVVSGTAYANNCPVLIDAIAANGLTATNNDVDLDSSGGGDGMRRSIDFTITGEYKDRETKNTEAVTVDGTAFAIVIDN